MFVCIKAFPLRIFYNVIPRFLFQQFLLVKVDE